MKKEEKTEITRNRIFFAAMEEFGSKGYTEGSVNNICKTGINKGLVYHNFKNKEELYLACVSKSCENLISYVVSHNGENSFVDYMNVRMAFFREHEPEANIFLEARTNPPHQLADKIREIFRKIDELNLSICEKELSGIRLRDDVSKEEALNYFSQIQRIYNLDFSSELKGTKVSPTEQLALHEMNIHKVFNFMLYGIAKGGNEQ